VLHIDHVRNHEAAPAQDLLKKASGRYYTGEPVGRRLASTVAAAATRCMGDAREISVLDPFGGDGRLIDWLVQAWQRQQTKPVSWNVELWDLSEFGFETARQRFDALRAAGIALTFDLQAVDSFRRADGCSQFDIVITNPPWELLKPDRRELKRLSPESRQAYIAAMRQYDEWLAGQYPISQPRRKFAGWGTNLSRVGLELSVRATRSAGIIGAVMPASLLADDQSAVLRRHLLSSHALTEVVYYPAEGKHYESADVASVTLVMEADQPPLPMVYLTTVGGTVENPIVDSTELPIDKTQLEASEYVLPVAFGSSAARLLTQLAAKHPSWNELESAAPYGLWAGREIDETGSSDWLVPLSKGGSPFLKGRMIDRFATLESPTLGVAKAGWRPTASMAHERIVWRDVSRPNQKRRVIATIVPAGLAVGNSLGVAYFRDGATTALRALLGVMCSTIFEFQLRAHLATGHVSLSSLRKIAVPTRRYLDACDRLHSLVDAALAGDAAAAVATDAFVAAVVYGVTRSDYEAILRLYRKIPDVERSELLAAYDEMTAQPADCGSHRARKTETPQQPCGPGSDVKSAVASASDQIHNHRAARLSDLDMRMVLAVPEGGNWKDIPHDIPSQRLTQIRESFARGEGSRSTYYGRLRRNKPAYTINTYFNRPGNGCHIHPAQDRVLTPREAARLQSFPDSFEFLGPQGAICTQIGNAVPPLLAFQIAKTLGTTGAFIDLFAGAGGMGLGFKWAGWRPIIANELEPQFVSTYKRNVHELAIAGSITDPDVVEAITTAAIESRRSGEPLWVLGGPPCQGFSTAGRRRTMEDPRNHLVWNYVRVLERVKPDGFVFENVTGLLNMNGGAVFEAVQRAFAEVMPSIVGTVVAADDYAIPQRRRRVLLIGRSSATLPPWSPPPTITATTDDAPTLFQKAQPAISVQEALWDLPPIAAGEDGQLKGYVSSPQTLYQALMRGQLNPAEYLARIARGERQWP
jgi:Alw26I/Eco31I/Esp3I family type II restriction m6 adenine DNA methyltransferase